MSAGQVEMIEITRGKGRMEQKRRPVSRAEYQAIQERKRKRALRRRRLQRIKLFTLLLGAAALLGILSGLLKDIGVKNEVKNTDGIVANKEVYPKALLEAYEKNPELKEFVEGYPTSDGSVTGGITKEELEQDFPLLLQYDGRWGYAAFGDDNIALSGCAPTCLSMVITALKKNGEAPPDAVARYCEEQGYYEKGIGTKWSVMTQGAEAFGVHGEEIGLDEQLIIKRLEAGSPIICSMGPGDFTTTGHFIVLTGVEDGKLRVNDPFSRERSGKLWEFQQIQYQIKNLWAFTLL